MFHNPPISFVRIGVTLFMQVFEDFNFILMYIILKAVNNFWKGF